MNINRKFPVFLFFLFKFVFNQNGIITLPFKKEIPDLKDVSPKDIILKQITNILMAEIKVGSESQKIMLRLEFESYIFYIAGKNSSSKIEFDQKKSKTYQKLGKKEIKINKSNLEEAILSSDYIYYDKNNKKYNTTFLLGTKTYHDNAGGLIGLNLEDEKEIKEYEKYNFINEIKRIGLIKDFYFTIKYNDKNSGNLIIGDLPHNYNKNYKKENYKDIYSDFSKNDLTWKIKFDEIYIGADENLQNKTKVQDYAYGYFRIEKSIIQATENYRQILLESFMTEQINKNLCFQMESNFYYSYYCKKEADISKMKTIYFYNNKLEYTFELTYKDLFYYNEYDENQYLLIVFNSEPDDEEIGYNDFWILGEPFFKKYQFFFDKSSKRIGFYQNIDNQNNNGQSWFSKNKWYIFLITLLVLLCLILGGVIFVFLRNRPKRKKKANELDDEFDYSSDKNRLVAENN